MKSFTSFLNIFFAAFFLQTLWAREPITASSMRTNPNHALIMAAGSNDLEAMKHALDNGADINTTEGSGGATPLICAAFGGQLKAVQFLIANKADLNRMDFTGNTALLYAVIGDRDVAIALVNAGADLKNSMGRTALMNTTDPEMIKLLKEAAAKRAATPSPTPTPSATPLLATPTPPAPTASSPMPHKAERLAPKEPYSNRALLFSSAVIIIGGIGFVLYRSRKR